MGEKAKRELQMLRMKWRAREKEGERESVCGSAHAHAWGAKGRRHEN